MELSQSSEGSYYQGMYSDPPVVRRVPLRDAATIDVWLTGDDGTTYIAIDAQCDVDFDREKIIRVVGVDSVLFTDPKRQLKGDLRHSLSAESQEFWIGRAQIYADDLGQWELDYIRDKVRASVALHGN